MSSAIVFPGQGSQSVGMVADLAASHPVVGEVFEEASGVLGFDLWRLVREGPEQELNMTINTQPALLAACVSVWRVWLAQGGSPPDAMAGHSLGEYTALVCAGALGFADAVALVADRGRYMQDAVPEGVGAMAAILGLDDDAVVDVCAKIAGDQVVSAANYNSPGQVVIAGHAAAVERAIAEAREAGARRAILLTVSVPSHCALMRAAADRLAQRLESIAISPAQIPVIQNVDAQARTDATGIKHALVEQLHQPVRWHESMRRLREYGITRIIECGPGKVLTGLCRKIDRNFELAAVQDSRSLSEALAGAGS